MVGRIALVVSFFLTLPSVTGPRRTRGKFDDAGAAAIHELGLTDQASSRVRAACRQHCLGSKKDAYSHNRNPRSPVPVPRYGLV